jgi:hypothetical protein
METIFISCMAVSAVILAVITLKISKLWRAL